MAIASTADPGPVAIAQGVDAIEIKDPDRPEPPQIAHETIAERNAEMGVTEERVPDVVAPPRESVRAAVDAATFEVQDRAEAPTATGETASRKVSAPLRGNDAAVSGPATDAPSDYTTPADNTTRADNTVNRRARVEELARVTREPQERSEGTAAAVRTPVTRVSRPAAYGSRAAEPAPPTEADELFRPVEDGMDRSPAAWMARLATSSRSKAASPLSTKTTLPATPASKRQAARAQQAVPVRSEDAAVGTPATARNERSSPHADAPGRLASSNVDKITVPSQLTQFLKPVVGVDAATVDILQGPRVAAVTQSLRAEALSIGTNTILVGREFDGRSAHDAGVLAHELTHIGRAREPRFVPPVIRRAGQRARGVETEEALATHVEADVVAAAETRMNRAAESGGPDLTRDQVMTPITVADEVRWGSLPAPWEPLPTWIGADPDVSEPTRRDHTAALGGTPLPSIAAEPTTAVHQRASVPASKLDAPLALHAADESRIVDHSPATSAAPGGADSSSPEQNAPDLDVLARQVYAVLKRRLEFETRREQLF